MRTDKNSRLANIGGVGEQQFKMRRGDLTRIRSLEVLVSLVSSFASCSNRIVNGELQRKESVQLLTLDDTSGLYL